MAKSHRSSKKTQGPKPIAEADKRQVLYDLGYVIDQLRGAYNLGAPRAPYLHSKLAATPVLPPPVYIEEASFEMQMRAVAAGPTMLCEPKVPGCFNHTGTGV